MAVLRAGELAAAARHLVLLSDAVQAAARVCQTESVHAAGGVAPRIVERRVHTQLRTLLPLIRSAVADLHSIVETDDE